MLAEPKATLSIELTPVRVGVVKDLLVRVSEPARVASVPVVGRVTSVAPEVVKVRL
jgi:hypothetical protein